MRQEALGSRGAQGTARTRRPKLVNSSWPEPYRFFGSREDEERAFASGVAACLTVP